MSYTTAAVLKRLSDHMVPTNEPEDALVVPLYSKDEPEPPSLTQVEKARAAATAIRLCSPMDATYVVKSVLFSVFGESELEALRDIEQLKKKYTPFGAHLPFKPIDFGGAIPMRLASHCFLHSLLRHGYHTEAAKFSEVMIRRGIHVRTRTMETIIASLCSATASQRARRIGLESFRLSFTSRAFESSDKFLSHTGSALAHRLLTHARKHGQKRSEHMYNTLIHALLRQGELIVAAMLFACLMKDWQIRAAARRRAEAETTQSDTVGSGVPETNPHDGLPSVATLPWTGSYGGLPWDTFLHAPYPDKLLLKEITSAIEAKFVECGGSGSDYHILFEPLQALALLTGLLTDGHFHNGKVSPLIRALYSCPKTDCYVWTYRHGQLAKVKAYSHFHETLLRIIKALKHPTIMKLPPLDRRACNALLHYTLRHRLSPRLASDILEYMSVERRLGPDTTTLNIIISSGTALRRADMSEAAIRILRQSSGQHQTDTPLLLEYNLPHPGTIGEPVFKKSRFGEALGRVRTEALRIPRPILSPNALLSADEATVVTYINYLTSTGNARAISNILFEILPELMTVDHPSFGSLSEEDRGHAWERDRQEGIKRSVALGPRVFTAILNALRKAGRTGLAERVWILAKTAERASWVEGLVPNVRPWYLPVAAYTIMMQVYADEGRKGFPTRRLASDGRVLWVPKTSNYVRGWARLVYETQRHPGWEEGKWTRYLAARTMAGYLFRAMVSGSNSVARSLLCLEKTATAAHARADIPVPVPDARFFNAALRVFRPLPGMLPRRTRITRSRVRRFLRWAYYRWNVLGARPTHWNSFLQEIGEAIAEAGYPLPTSFRHLFVGRYEAATRHFECPKTPHHAPYTFPPPRYRFRAHALPTSKTRGLPIRRVRPRARPCNQREQPTDTGSR
jgi:pentatricopeptide repeat protein